MNKEWIVRDDENGDEETVGELIRCKDCKHCYTEGSNVIINCCELNHNKAMPDDWFCADAERKEE